MATKMTRQERERVLTIIETAAVVLLALVAAWRLDVDVEKLASISADQWVLIASGLGGCVVAVRNAWRESVRRPAIAERETPVEPRRPEEGMTHPETLAWVLCYALLAGLALSRALAHVGAVLLVVVAAAGLTGCGGGILATHARAATIALVSIEGAQRAIAAGHQAEVAACPDPACVAEVDSRWIPAGGVLDATLPVVLAWVGTLEVAELAGTPDAELESVLELAMARAVEVWDRARDALDTVGLELPALGGGR